jgi:serine/threonine-protein kinase
VAIAQQPQRYGKCVIEREIGRGARSIVYLAWHEGLQIPVAVKVMKKEGGEDEELFSERFMREARIAAQLTHPNIVRVYDCGETEDSYYLVLEYIQGESCRDRMTQGEGFDWETAVRLIREVADGLNHASKKGIIHRDVKPENIMIDNEGTARIADLGLAKEVGGRGSATADGDVLGTPYYMSPEQVRSPGEVDFRSDIYSLGATLYHMVSDEVPFEAQTPFEIMTKHLNEPLVPPQEVRSDLPEALCDIILRAMAKEPQNRYQSYRDLIRDLDELSGGKPRPRDEVMAAVEETLAESVEAGKAAAPPEPRPRPLRPIELPVTSYDVRGKALGVIAVLTYALLPVCLYHAVLSWAGPIVAFAALLMLVALGVLCSCAVLRRAGAADEAQTADAMGERLSAALGWVCERLDLPVPKVRVSDRRDEQCRVYSFFSHKACLYLPGGWLSRVGLDTAQMRAFLARQLAGVYTGDADIRTVLALPEGLLARGSGALRRLLGAMHSLSARRRLYLGRAIALVGFCAICVAIAALFWLSALAGLLGLSVVAVLMVTSAFERNCAHAGDRFAVRVVEDEDAVRSLVVLSGLTNDHECYRLLRDSLGRDVADKGLDDLPEGTKRAELVEAVAEHYTSMAYLPDAFEVILKVFSGLPSAAERLNRLAGLPQGSSPVLAGVTVARRVYGGMLGEPEKRMNLYDLADVKLYGLTGLVGGLLAVGSMAFLTLRGRGGYGDFLILLVALGAVLGSIVALRSCRSTVSPGKLGWDMTVASVGLCVATMLGFCLTGWPAVTPLAFQFLVAMVAVLVQAAALGVLLVRVGPRLGIRVGGKPYESRSRTHHTVALDKEEREFLMRTWKGGTGEEDEGGGPPPGSARAPAEDE